MTDCMHDDTTKITWADACRRIVEFEVRRPLSRISGGESSRGDPSSLLRSAAIEGVAKDASRARRPRSESVRVVVDSGDTQRVQKARPPIADRPIGD